MDIDGPNLRARGQILPLGGGAALYDSGFQGVSSTWLANLDSASRPPPPLALPPIGVGPGCR